MAAGQERLIALLLHLLFAALLAGLAAVSPITVDEPNYLHAGIALVEHFDFRAYVTILHGPLPLLANQGLAWLVPPLPIDGYLFAGRLSMLPFALLAAFFTWRLARRLLSPVGGLVALFLFVTNPIVLSHGCLMTADMALTTFWTGAVLAAARWLEAPSLLRASALGATLGLALATKFLSVLLLPAVALGLGLAVLRGLVPWRTWSRPDGAASTPSKWTTRLHRTVPAFTLCTITAFCTLWLCYGLQPSGYELRAPISDNVSPQDPDAGALSTMFRDRVSDPVFTSVLRVLPEPFVRGIDYQLRYAESGGPTRFAGRIGQGFVAYYPTALLVKLPLLTVLLLFAGLLWRRPRLPRNTALLLAATTLIPIAYLSLFSTMQMGVRYLLMVVPLLCVVAARPVVTLFAHRLGRLIVMLLTLCVVYDVVVTWPKQLGAVNMLAGKKPHLLFSDSNLGWRPAWAPDPDGERVRQKYPEAALVHAGTGPRLGLVRAPLSCFMAQDPLDPTRTYHWLQRFEPIDRQGEWFVFDVSEHLLREATEQDLRARTELAIALLHGGRADEVAALVDVSSPVGQAAEFVTSGKTSDPRYARLLLELGLCETLLALPDVAPQVRAKAWFVLGEVQKIQQELTALEVERPLSGDEALLLAGAFLESRDLDRAISVLERYRPVPAAGVWDRLLDRLKSQRDGLRASGG